MTNDIKNSDELDLFLSGIFERAYQGFMTSPQGKLLREKRERMENNCEYEFTSDERVCAEEHFALLDEISGEREYHLYRQGMLDCVGLLKWLGVLA